jgi:hypothetical protein
MMAPSTALLAIHTRQGLLHNAAQRLSAKTWWRRHLAQVMSDHAGEGIGMRMRNTLYSASPRV